VQHRKDHVDLGMSAGLGQDRARTPLTLLIDKVRDRLVLLGVQRGHHGLRGADGHFVFAGTAAIKDGNSQFHRIRFPRPDMTSSTAKSAVRFRSSMTGFTSTTSSET